MQRFSLCSLSGRRLAQSARLYPRQFTASSYIQSKVKITDGVEFDTIAREWRMKWSADNDKKSLADVQKTLDKLIPTIKKIEGVKSVQRVVCGGCQDYKVCISSIHFQINPRSYYLFMITWCMNAWINN
jgi:hypothetical protein